MATITGKRFQITDGASTPTNLFPYTVAEAVYGLSNTISNAISTALSALSLSTYAGTSQIGSATQPVYYNGSALVATNLSTTYAPYNANGYLPLNGGDITGPLGLRNVNIQFKAADGTVHGLLSADANHVLSWYDTSAWRTILHSGNYSSYALPRTGGTMSGNITMGENAVVFNSTQSSSWENPKNSGLRILNALGTTVTGAPRTYVVGLSVSGYYGFQLASFGGEIDAFYIRSTTDGSAAKDWRTIYHSGNSNLSTVPWACSTLTVSGTIQASGNAYCGAIFDLNRDGSSGAIKDSTKMGMEIEATASYIAFKPYTSSGAAWGTILSLSSSGNVGISTTTPAYKLDVNGSIGCSTLTASGNIVLGAQSETATTQHYLYLWKHNSSGHALRGLLAETDDGLQISHWNATTQAGFNSINISSAAVTIPSGNVGIGTASPSQKLHVEGSIYAAGGYRTNSALLGLFKGSGITSTLTENDGALYYYNHTLAVWANLFQIYGDIVSTGDQVISSDLNLKENLTPVTYSVSDIAKARAVEFDWKDGRGHSMGSIAQDWLSIAPALVHGEEGNMSLAYGQLALVNTIIEAREIETLKARVAELEAEVKRLRMN